MTLGYTENLSINAMNKNFGSNLLFQGSIEQDYLLKIEKIFGVFNKNISFSTEFQHLVLVSLKDSNL